MVRDLALDIKECDLLTKDKSNSAVPVFDSIWGDLFDEDAESELLICNVIIPEAYWNMIEYTDKELIFRFTSPYMPDISYFNVRLVALKDGKHSLFGNIHGDFGAPVSSYAVTRNVGSRIAASMLPYVDIDGEFLVRLVERGVSETCDQAYIYSSKLTDLCVDYSDSQASQLLSICAPGKSYRYPTAGVGITNYLNSVIAHSDLYRSFEAQFESDGKPIQYVGFDNENGNLDVLATPEKETGDADLADVSELCSDFFKMFSDEYVRRNIVVNTVSDTDFMSLMDDFDRILEIIFFKDDTCTAHRIAGHVVAGAFNGVGDVVESDEYCIVSAALEGNTVIMFDDEEEDRIKDSPVFIVNGSDETRLYTSLVEQPYWITESCHKCFILKHDATVRYMVSREQFQKGRGLYVVPQTSANIKNMLGVVQDKTTGSILGVVSDNTNISDISLNEVTQHIYATHSVS